MGTSQSVVHMKGIAGSAEKKAHSFTFEVQGKRVIGG